MRDFIDGLFALSKTIVIGVTVVIIFMLIMIGMIFGFALA